MDKILHELESEKDIAQMEAIFKSKLYTSSYTNKQLEKLRINAIIKRHAGLQYIFEKAIGNNNFKSSNERAKRESALKKIFIGIGLWP